MYTVPFNMYPKIWGICQNDPRNQETATPRQAGQASSLSGQHKLVCDGKLLVVSSASAPVLLEEVQVPAAKSSLGRVQGSSSLVRVDPEDDIWGEKREERPKPASCLAEVSVTHTKWGGRGFRHKSLCGTTTYWR